LAAQADPGQEPKKDAAVRGVEWTTISYRSIYSIAGVAALIVAAVVVWWYIGKTPAPTPTPSAPSESAARFTAIEGTVRARPVDRPDWLAATLNLLLHRGDLVQTGNSSTAEITFFDDAVLRVRPDSLITIEETSEDRATGLRRSVSRIGKGNVDFNALKGTATGESVREFRTSTMTMQVGSEAEGDIHVGETGDSNVKIFRGRADVKTTGGQNVSLAQNEGIVVDAAGQAGEKVALPAAPVLASPVNDGELQYPNPANATTLLLWKAVPGASGYRVMVDFSPQFSRPLVDRVRKGVSLELHGLDAGKYYWRVASVNAKDIEGSFSDHARFSVRRISGPVATGQPPNLDIEAIDVRSNILQIRGRSDPGSTLTVNGHEIDVQPDGTFNEFVTLEKAGRQDVRIRAVGLSGGVREMTRSVLVAY
jgi:hypothetical protein